METILPFLMGLAMFATLAVVVVGIISFAVNGRFYRRHANHMMRLRVVLQAVALVIFALLMALFAR